MLEETIFYALSGGQESDQGWINNIPVLRAQKDGIHIWYTLSEPHNLECGDRVCIEIDWERRYRLMRLHFAAELVLELLYRCIPQLCKTGAHISANKARIDIEATTSIRLFLPKIQQDLDNIIHQALPITSAFSDEILQRRYWQIEGFAAVPCGGTHIRNTCEVGCIALKHQNPGKGKERIEIYLS